MSERSKTCASVRHRPKACALAGRARSRCALAAQPRGTQLTKPDAVCTRIRTRPAQLVPGDGVITQLIRVGQGVRTLEDVRVGASPPEGVRLGMSCAIEMCAGCSAQGQVSEWGELSGKKRGVRGGAVSSWSSKWCAVACRARARSTAHPKTVRVSTWPGNKMLHVCIGERRRSEAVCSARSAIRPFASTCRARVRSKCALAAHPSGGCQI